jgi:hypothetical protein
VAQDTPVQAIDLAQMVSNLRDGVDEFWIVFIVDFH